MSDLDPWRSKLENCKTVGKVYAVTRGLPLEAFPAVEQIALHDRRKTVRRRMAPALLRLLALRIKEGEADWDPGLDAIIDMPLLARCFGAFGEVDDWLLTVLRAIPKERGRALFDAAWDRKEKFAVGLYAFRFAPTVDDTVRAFEWLSRHCELRDLDDHPRLVLISWGLRDIADPTVPLRPLLERLHQRGLSISQYEVNGPRYQLMRFIRSGFDQVHPSGTGSMARPELDFDAFIASIVAPEP